MRVSRQVSGIEGDIKGLTLAIAAALALASGSVLAHGSAAGDAKEHAAGAASMGKSMHQARYANPEEHPFGKASDPATAELTIEIGMSDAMRFEPSVIQVKPGQPVRFVVGNHGKLMHEMVIGTRDALDQHAAMMKKFPGMEHDEPYMAHVAPGERGEMGWTFTQPGEYFYGCLVPGHFEGGMVGRVVVK